LEKCSTLQRNAPSFRKKRHTLKNAPNLQKMETGGMQTNFGTLKKAWHSTLIKCTALEKERRTLKKCSTHGNMRYT